MKAFGGLFNSPKNLAGLTLSVFFLPGFLTTPAAAASSKPFTVAIVLPGDEWASSVAGLKDGMTALGYAEGRDVSYLLDNAKGDKGKVLAATRKFTAEKVDVIFTITNTALKVVAEATRAAKIPVVFGSASGPVESGIVPAYATPATHVTGVTSGSIELVAKRLEILKDVLPGVKRVAAVGDLDSDSSMKAFAVAAQAAAKLSLNVMEIRVTSKEHALETSKKLTLKQADALFLIPGLQSVGATVEVAAAAITNRMPFAAYQIEHAKKDGALLSYGSSYYLQGRQSASLVQKILKGVPVGHLPIERPSLHQLVINLATAKEIGLRLSPEIVNRADELVGARE